MENEKWNVVKQDSQRVSFCGNYYLTFITFLLTELKWARFHPSHLSIPPYCYAGCTYVFTHSQDHPVLICSPTRSLISFAVPRYTGNRRGMLCVPLSFTQESNSHAPSHITLLLAWHLPSTNLHLRECDVRSEACSLGWGIVVPV